MAWLDNKAKQMPSGTKLDKDKWGDPAKALDALHSTLFYTHEHL